MKIVVPPNVYRGLTHFPLSTFHEIPWKIIVEKSVVRFPLSISTGHTLKCVCPWKIVETWKGGTRRELARSRTASGNGGKLCMDWRLDDVMSGDPLRIVTAQEIGKRATPRAGTIFAQEGGPSRLSRSRARLSCAAGRLGEILGALVELLVDCGREHPAESRTAYPSVSLPAIRGVLRWVYGLPDCEFLARNLSAC